MATASEEKAYKADQMGLMLTSEAWRIYTEPLRRDLEREQNRVLRGDYYKTYEDYKEACGRIDGLSKALRYPHVIRQDAGVPMPAEY